MQLRLRPWPVDDDRSFLGRDPAWSSDGTGGIRLLEALDSLLRAHGEGVSEQICRRFSHESGCLMSTDLSNVEESRVELLE